MKTRPEPTHVDAEEPDFHEAFLRRIPMSHDQVLFLTGTTRLADLGQGTPREKTLRLVPGGRQLHFRDCTAHGFPMVSVLADGRLAGSSSKAYSIPVARLSTFLSSAPEPSVRGWTAAWPILGYFTEFDEMLRKWGLKA